MFPPHLLKRKNMAMMLDRSSSSSSSSDSGSSSSSSDSDSESSPASGSDRCWTFTKVVDDFHSVLSAEWVWFLEVGSLGARLQPAAHYMWGLLIWWVHG
ncbi:hypothetical protein V6N13_086691 [Hibiscus sabdariffa]|uniref:Uncharacterized protein n=1 Tax=Hibiscus sabdariffa TaxID=183260 RepID=A0ABR2FU81_9ROSI